MTARHATGYPVTALLARCDAPTRAVARHARRDEDDTVELPGNVQLLAAIVELSYLGVEMHLCRFERVDRRWCTAVPPRPTAVRIFTEPAPGADFPLPQCCLPCAPALIDRVRREQAPPFSRDVKIEVNP